MPEPEQVAKEKPGGSQRAEPLFAHLYFVPRAINRPQAFVVRNLHGYFSSAPGWVLLTTRGRTTGLPREVLLPCVRAGRRVIVISTYGWRSNWIRNIRKNPAVEITWGGRKIAASARVVEDLEEKRELVSRHPFLPTAPFAALNLLARTVLRPLTAACLRLWVSPRPVVVITPLARAARDAKRVNPPPPATDKVAAPN